MNHITADLVLSIMDPTGALLARTRRPADPLVAQALDIFFLMLNNHGSLTITDITNTGRSSSYNSQGNVAAPAATSTYGIVPGTGTNAVTISGYALQTQIAHGNAASQLNYQATVLGAPATIGISRQFVISRNFNNNSGGDITVQEIALYNRDQSNAYSFMLARDLTGGILIPNTKTFAAQYVISISV